MLQYKSHPLDRAFHALSDPSRRAMVERLCHAPASVSELAERLPMTLSAVTQHLKVLEQAGLIKTSKAGRVRTCSLDAEAMGRIELWIAQRKQFWERHYDQLEAYLASTSPTEQTE